MDFNAFINDIRTNSWNVFGAEVYTDGSLTHSWGDTTIHRYPIYSATKTITSIAIGMAVDEGRMDIGNSVLKYLPGHVTARLDAAQKETYRKITLERLMTMSVCGYPFRPEGESWLDFSLQIPLTDPNRREFDYSNISAYLAGVAAACALDEDLYEYLDRKLFQPLNIIAPPCGRCPDGYFYGASKMELTVNELSRIGLMLCNGGVYDGRRIISSEYVKAATSIQQMNREGGYGYFIWKYRNGFSINGKWKQKCYVLPEEKLMITFLSHIENSAPGFTESMEKHIIRT